MPATGVLDSPKSYARSGILEHGPAGETHAYTLEEEVQMLAILPEPAATIGSCGAFTGAAGENPWSFLERLRRHAIEVKQSVWRNHVGEPSEKRAKEPSR